MDLNSIVKDMYPNNCLGNQRIMRGILFYFILFIYFWLHYVFVAARRLFSSCGEWGLFFIVVSGLLIAAASLVAEHGL